MKRTECEERTRERLLDHCQTYPKLKAEDIFKYLFQSVFGCEHMVSDEGMALTNLKREYGGLVKTESPTAELLDGEYSRIYLSCLDHGLKPETLARLFCLSAKKEPAGKDLLEQKLQAAKALVAEGKLPFDQDDFGKRLDEWRGNGYPAIHHSGDFRMAYRPAYRVVANRYAELLPLFMEIDRLSCKGALTVAIEGGSASGKTTLSDILRQVYDCNVFHMDDFFLRPEQRTPWRYAEIGGNVDRERFADEVLKPLLKRETVRYRPFDCTAQALRDPIAVAPKSLTLIEGVYSTHSAFGRYYDLSVFLDITPDCQKERILLRNTPALAKRFFDEWIPLENRYFLGADVKERADLVLPVRE